MKKNKLKQLIIFANVVVIIILLITIIAFFATTLKRDTQEISVDPVFGNIPKDKIDNSNQQLPSTINFFSINSTNFDFNNTLNVYKLDKDSKFFANKSFVTQIAEKFNLQKSNENQDQIIYLGENSSLLYNKNSFSFTLDLSANTEINNKISEEKAVKDAKEFLRNNNLLPYSNEEILTTIQHFETTNFNYYPIEKQEKSSLLEVRFSKTIEDIPIFTESSLGEIKVLVSSQGVEKVKYKYIKNDLTNTGIYPRAPIETRANNIQNYQASFFYPYEAEVGRLLNVNSVFLVYKTIENSDFLVPTYMFTATDNNENQISILTPAIQDEYLKE